MSHRSIVYTIPMRSTGTAYLWWIFLGGIGAHKFYLGKPIMGIVYIFTFGLLGFGHLYDLFTMSWQVRRANDAIMSGTGFREASSLFSGNDNRLQLNETAIDEMYARYAAGQREAFHRAVAPPAVGAVPVSAPGGFGRRRS